MRRLVSRILHATDGLALCHLDTKAGGSKKSDEMTSQSTTVSQVARKEDLEEFRRQKNERFEENWQRWFGKEVHLIPFPSFQSWKT